MASDVTRPGDFKVGTNTYVAVETDGADEADRAFTGMADGGCVEMPLQKVEWAEKFGICADRFGAQWIVSHTGHIQLDRQSGSSGQSGSVPVVADRCRIIIKNNPNKATQTSTSPYT